MRFGLAFLLLGLLATACRDPQPDTPPPIRLGTYGPLTGPAASWGVMLKAMDAYLDFVNAQGGLHGRQVELVMRDDRYEASKTPLVVRDLVENEEVFAIVGGLGTANGRAVAAYLADKGVPFFTPASGDPFFTRPPREDVYTVYPRYDTEGELIGRYLAGTQKKHRVAVLHQDDGFGAEGAAGLARGLEAFGAEIVVRATCLPTDGDVSGPVARIAAADADALVLFTAPRQGALAVRRLHRLGNKPPIFTSFVLSDPVMFELAGPEAWEGTITSSVRKLPNSDDPSVVQYREVLAKYGPDLPVGSFTMSGFAFAQPFVAALEMAGPDPTPEKVYTALRSMRDWASGGPYWRGTGLNPPLRDGVFAIVLANEQDMDQVIDGMKAIHAARVPLPDFLSAEPSAHKAEIADRIEAARLRCLANIEQFDALAEDTQLAGLLNRVAVIEWLQANSGDVSASRHMMRITGWTSSADGRDLRALLDAAHLEYALTLVDTAPGDPPMVLENPRWFKPFEFFPRMLGVPADRNVDPSVLVAVIAPVLFGFMFGDVGQGAVLLIAGLVLSRRFPLLALLIPAGAMAMVFGVLFGSVFSVEHVILALWLRPLDEPITILAVALGLGVVLLLLGQAMELVQAVWQGKLRHWLGEAGAVSLAWVGLLGAWFVPPLAWLSLAGLALALVLARDEAGAPGLAASGKAAAEFAEGLMRLLVSTVSFARVGAFALAHAGLSAAIVGVADALGGVGFWIALIVGNLIIIALEGLVTGIQTTRLILFEFFLRFFKAEGREFHPLSVPQIHAKQGTTP